MKRSWTWFSGVLAVAAVVLCHSFPASAQATFHVSVCGGPIVSTKVRDVFVGQSITLLAGCSAAIPHKVVISVTTTDPRAATIPPTDVGGWSPGPYGKGGPIYVMSAPVADAVAFNTPGPQTLTVTGYDNTSTIHVNVLSRSPPMPSAPQVRADTSFGTGGIAFVAPATAFALTSGGKILTVGSDGQTQVLRRFTKAGAPDVTFGNEGVLRLFANGSALSPDAYTSLLVAPDDRVYLAMLATDGCKVNAQCRGAVLARYLADGTIDTSFGVSGFASLSIATHAPVDMDVRLAFAPDGTIVAAENAYTASGNTAAPIAVQTRIERFETTGASVASWPVTAACGAGAYVLKVQANGAIVVGVSPTPGAAVQPRCLYRYTAAGTVDVAFGNAGVIDWGASLGARQQITGMLLGVDGKIVLGVADPVTGNDVTSTLARYLPSGELDVAFGVPNGARTASANARAFASSCGRILGVAFGLDEYFAYLGLTRYTSNGAVDGTAAATPQGVATAYSQSIGDVAGEPQDIVVRDDGVVVVLYQRGFSYSTIPLSVLAAFRQVDCQHPKDTSRLAVVEYYNESLDHYFVTQAVADMAALDSGRFTGWQRTGVAFATSPATANPVCRFYIPPAQGDSHFFSASPAECGEVQQRFPQLVLETFDAFRIAVPDAVTGACPPSSPAPIYRVWNNREASNHRYMTDKSVRDAMVAAGWIAEGYGPDQVVMCALAP